MTNATTLMPLMQFDDNDLCANRQGELGENQRERLQNLKMRLMLVGLGGFIGFALLATTFLFFGQTNSIIWTFLGIFITIINAIFIGMVGQQWMRLTMDLRNKTVDILEGELERVIKANQRAGNYVLRVDDTDFAVKKDLFVLFDHEVPYRLYRAPHSNVLLAAEPL